MQTEFIKLKEQVEHLEKDILESLAWRSEMWVGENTAEEKSECCVPKNLYVTCLTEIIDALEHVYLPEMRLISMTLDACYLASCFIKNREPQQKSFSFYLDYKDNYIPGRLLERQKACIQRMVKYVLESRNLIDTSGMLISAEKVSNKDVLNMIQCRQKLRKLREEFENSGRTFGIECTEVKQHSILECFDELTYLQFL